MNMVHLRVELVSSCEELDEVVSMLKHTSLHLIVVVVIQSHFPFPSHFGCLNHCVSIASHAVVLLPVLFGSVVLLLMLMLMMMMI